MKNTMKKILSLLLVLVMFLGGVCIPDAINLNTVNAAETESFAVGDVIEFGSYPQTEVTDSAYEGKTVEYNNKIFKVGSRIINKKNDYEKGILNGELGMVISANKKYMTVKFDEGHIVEFKKAELENIELGYAISVHSSQGSQYKVTIVAMDMSSYTLLTSNMIYTAMTRACDKLIVMSQPSAFSRSVTNVQEHYRNTYLKLLLSEIDKNNMKNKVKEYSKDHRCVYKKSLNTLSLHDDEEEIIMNNFVDSFSELPF